MSTLRYRSLLAVSVLGLLAGLLFRQDGLALLGLTVVLWLGLEWIGFYRRVLAADHAFTDWSRTIKGLDHDTITVTVDQDCEVELSGSVEGPIASLRLWIEDVVPDGCQLPQGPPVIVLDPDPPQRWRLRYVLRPNVIGRLAVSGIRVHMTDAQGFFRFERFLPLRQQLSVLPFLIRPQTTVSVLKRNNVQMLTGTHRHRRPGFGTELLGIREYAPGDPPRNIAWKASARLGRLMSCEYESEVPARATIIADLSSYHFRGRPGPALADRIIAVAASLARLLLADRDPVACVCVAESECKRIPHAYGERQLTRLLQVLLSITEASGVAERTSLSELINLTWSNCVLRFPELFERHVNPAPGAGFLGRNRRSLRGRRGQVCFVLAELYNSTPGAPLRWRTNDVAFRKICARFLSDYQPVGANVTTQHSQDERAAHLRTTESVARVLVESANRANDNELFVLIGHLPHEAPDRECLLESVRVVRAGYHRVIVVDAGTPPLQAFTDPLAERLVRLARRRAIQSAPPLDRDLLRLGAKLSRIDDPKLIENLAMEVELLKSGRLRSPVTARAPSWRRRP